MSHLLSNCFPQQKESRLLETSLLNNRLAHPSNKGIAGYYILFKKCQDNFSSVLKLVNCLLKVFVNLKKK